MWMSGICVALSRSEAAKPFWAAALRARRYMRACRRSKPPWVSDKITRSGDFDAIGFRQVLCGASGAGALPGDGVFVPVSPVYLLTRPNRMTVSPGTRAGTATTHRASRSGLAMLAQSRTERRTRAAVGSIA
jgi:hypothetical protein